MKRYFEIEGVKLPVTCDLELRHKSPGRWTWKRLAFPGFRLHSRNTLSKLEVISLCLPSHIALISTH
jgi:hypothetical protein